MKITYLHQHFKLPTESGGSRPYEFARRLAQDGHDVTVIAGGEETSSASVDGFRVLRVSAPYDNAMSFNARIRAFLKYVVGATIVALRTPCDLVFASSTPLTAAVPALVTHWIRRRPMVFEVRDLWPELPIQLGVLKNPVLISFARTLERRAYVSSEAVVALSPWMQEGVKAVAPEVHTALIPNACDFAQFNIPAATVAIERRNLGWSEKFVLVYAGSFGVSYGLEWLVELAARLDDRFEVVIFGEGASGTELRVLANSLGLDAQKLLPGEISKAEVALRYACADAVVSCLSDVPVLEHNSLNKVFDGLAAGKPVITNHGGWLSDLIEEYGAGARLSRDARQAEGQLVRGLATWGIDQMGLNATRLGRDHFDRDALYEKLETTLSEAVLWA